MLEIEYDQLVLRNAYLYEHCSFPLHKQGLVLIRGLNLDDGGFLGAGKSTLFDAWARVQFGKGGKQDTVADIMNPSLGQDLEIVLKLKVGGKGFEIRQFRNHSQHGTSFQVVDLAKNENILPLEYRTHPQVWIRDHLLHTDETSFFNTAYLTQSHTHVLLHGKEAERRQKLTSMFGLDVYDSFADQLRQMEKVHEGDLNYLSQSTSRLSELAEQLKKCGDADVLVTRLAKVESKLLAAKEGLTTCTDELNGLQEQLAKVRLRYNLDKERDVAWSKAVALHKEFRSPDEVTQRFARKCQRRYEKVTGRKARMESRLSRAKERSIIESQLANLDEDLELAGDIDKVEADLLDLKTRLHHLTAVERPDAEKRKELGQRLAKLGKVSGDLDTLRETQTKLNQTVHTLEQQIRRDVTRLEQGVCSECKRPLNMSDSEVEKLRSNLKSARSEVKRVRGEHYANQNMLTQLEQHHELTLQLDALTTTRTLEELDREIAGLVKQEKKLSRLSELAKQRSALENKLSSLPVLKEHDSQAAIDQLTAGLSTLRSLLRSSQRLAELNRKLKDLPAGSPAKLERAVKDLRSDVRTLTSQIGSRSQKVANLQAKISTVRKLRDEYVALKKKIRDGKKLQQRLACLGALRQAFGPKGIKQRRFHSILNDATENTIPVYSQLLWPSKQVSLELEDDDGIKFYLRREGQKQMVHSNVLSGGEKHKAGLAFLLGLRDLKEVYTGNRFNVLVVDEPFGNLDPQGEQAFLSILEMLKDRFGSIFIISHRPEVIGSSVWDQTWWVIRKNHRSQLYLETPPTKYLRMAEKFMTTDGD